MSYTKNTKQTKDYLDVIEKYLVAKYGKVNPEWNGLLQLLADNLDLYKECQKSVKQYGIYDPSTGKKNPLLATMKDLQATILKQIQHLGISPYASSKIKEADDDNTDDFMKNLLGE